jgi:hypothetical protein
VTHHSIQFLDIREFTRSNINALIEKWIPSYMFWAPRSRGFECHENKNNEKNISEIIETKEFWSILIIPKVCEN